MTSSLDILLALVRNAIGTERFSSLPLDVNWPNVCELAMRQGISGIAYDGLSRFVEENGNNSIVDTFGDADEWNDFISEWGTNVYAVETKYEHHMQLLARLSGFYGMKDIRMLVVKGYSASLMYPVPSHRAAGDIDIYLYGKGRLGDELVASHGLEVKQNEDKHSCFNVEGVSIENHAMFVNVLEHPKMKELEQLLEQEAERAIYDEQTGVWLPTLLADALFLPAHLANHFVYGGASLKQVVDWAVLTARYGEQIDWDRAFLYADNAGYGQFVRNLNGIVMTHFGVPEQIFPAWNRNRAMEERVWKEIICPAISKQGENSIGKTSRYFRSRWKYNLVFKESMLSTFFRRGWALYREKHLPNSKTVWK